MYLSGSRRAGRRPTFARGWVRGSVDETVSMVENTHLFAPNKAHIFMSITQAIYARTTVSMTDLRRNPSAILQGAGDEPVAVLNHNKPTAYLLSARAYEALLDRLDDAQLQRIARQRRGGKTVKVKLEDL